MAATREILRQASVALGGQPVWLWEVAEPKRLELKVSSHAEADAHAPEVDLYSTIERWAIPTGPGTRWVGSRAWAEGPWLIAPVRSRPPAPPPAGRERRSRERITLELAGLCVGLGDRAGQPEVQDLASLPATMVHELSNPLAAAHASLHLAMESIGRSTDLPAGRRLELLDELGLVNDDIDRAIAFLRSMRSRLRGQATT